MRTSVRGEEIPHVGRVPATIHGAADTRGFSANRNLRLSGTNPAVSRRVAANRVGGGAFRVRAHPSDLRVRRELPHPEVSPGAEHRGAELVHFVRHARVPPRVQLGGGEQAGDGPVWRVAGAQHLLVGHRGGAVHLHREE